MSNKGSNYRIVNFLAFLTLTTACLSDSYAQWEHHKPVYIDNSSNPSALTDYQVEVLLDSVNFDFGEANSDGSDIRFFAGSKVAIPYWIEYYDAAAESARIWVEVPSIPANGKTQIYMHYGNLEAQDESDFDNTFTKDFADSGLAGLWHFDERTGDTLYDASGRGNHGVCRGSALEFDGVDDIVEVADDSSLNLPTGVTIEAWICEADGWTGWSRIVAKPHTAQVDPYNLYVLHLEAQSPGSQKAMFAISSGVSGSGKNVASVSTVPLDTWVHVVGTYDQTAGELRIYFNGTLENTSPASITIGTNNMPLTIGRNYYTGADQFRGKIDDVRLYNRALSETEVAEHYRGIYSDTTGLVGCWRFSEGSGNTTADASGRGNHGILKNGLDTSWVEETPALWQAKDGGQWDSRSDIGFSSGDALAFNGFDDYVEVQDSDDFYFGTEPLTIEWWVRFNDSTGIKSQLGQSNGGGIKDKWGVVYNWPTEGQLTFYVAHTGWFEYTMSTNWIAAPDTWHYLAITRDWDTWQWYLDGTTLGSAITNDLGGHSIANVVSTLNIGADGELWRHHAGAMDEVRIYRRALTLDEIKCHYERRKYTSPEPAVTLGEEWSVASSTYPNQNLWYNTNDPSFGWGQPDLSITGYYWAFDSDPHTIPTISDNFTTDTTLPSLLGAPFADTTWHFHIASEDAIGHVGTYVAHYRANIDAYTDVSSPTHPNSQQWFQDNDPILSWMKRPGISDWYYEFDHSSSTLPDTNSSRTTDTLLSFTNVESGVWYFHIVSKDTTGRVATTVSRCTVKVDVIPPDPCTTLAAYSLPHGIIGLGWIAPQDQHSGIAKYEIWRSVTHGFLGTVIDTSFAVSCADSDTAFLQHGRRYHYTIMPIDSVGNKRDISNNQTSAVCDKTSPLSPLVSSPTHASQTEWYRNDSPEFNWASIQDTVSGIRGYWCILDRISETVPDTTDSLVSDTIISYVNVSEGIWYFHVLTQDGAGNMSFPPAHYVIRIDKGPHIVLDTIDGEVSRDILFDYKLTDVNPSDTLAITCEYLIALDTVWRKAIVTGDTAELDSSEWLGGITWNSDIDLPGVDTLVRFRITPSDLIGIGFSDSIPCFHLDNNMAPSVEVLDLVGEQSGNVPIAFVCSDPEDDSLTLVYEYSTNSGEAWNPATVFDSCTSMDTTIIVWDSNSDLPDVDLLTVRFKIIPFDSDTGTKDETTDFHLDNNELPQVSILNPQGEQSGDISIAFVVSDAEDDSLTYIYLFSVNSGSTWDTATVAGGKKLARRVAVPGEGISITSMRKAISSISHQSFCLDTSTITWRSASNLPNTDLTTVRFKIIPFDNDEGVSGETDDFHVDNCLPAQVLSVSPEAGATVIWSSNLEAIFSRAVNPGSLSGKIVVKGAMTGEHSGSISYDNPARSVSFDPDLFFGSLDTITVTLSAAITDSLGNTLDGNRNGDSEGSPADDYSWIFCVSPFGDYDGDTDIDFDDLMDGFRNAWNGQDLSKEIGPATGSVPYLISQPDGKVDFEDLMVFGQMWNWSWTEEKLQRSMPEGQRLCVIQTGIQEDAISFDIVVKEVTDFAGARLVMTVPGGAKTTDVSNGHFLGSNDGTVAFVKRIDEEKGIVEIQTCRLSQDNPSVSGRGTIASLQLALERLDSGLQVEVAYELRSSDNEIIEQGIATTEIRSEPVPGVFKLHQNYPNPFSKSTLIKYQIPPAEEKAAGELIPVKLQIYDISGKRVVSLVEEKQKPGYYVVEWNTKGYSSGIYFLRFSGGTYKEMRKIILIEEGK